MRIDMVIPWVDGSDPEWVKEKNKFLGTKAITANTAENRFRDWGLMKYWFRSLEMYAPWIHTVHFVTWGHLPDFLDISCQKLHIVNHRDYIPEEYLPTFNSHTLELNMHKIPGLSEHFIYSNDDFFLTRTVKPSDFFDLKTGYPRLPFSEVPLRFKGSVSPIQEISANDIAVINKHFHKAPILSYPGKYLSFRYSPKENIRSLTGRVLFPEYYSGVKNHHGFSPFRKQTFNEVWEAEPELLDRTCRDKFRDNSHVNQWLVLWWQIAEGTFKPKENSNMYYNASLDTVGSILRSIHKQTYESICINDPEMSEDWKEVAGMIADVLEKTLPQKSGFEKQ